MNGIIYCATFTNGRVYVGQTIWTLEARKAEHKYFAEHNKDNVIFHRAIRKYGFNNIFWEILEENISNLEELNEREIYWIKEKKSYNKENRKGCNMTPGGDNRNNLCKYTEEDITKMVERYKECGNSNIIAKEFGTNSSVVMKHIKSVLPNYKEYSYEGRGHQQLYSDEQKQKMYDYFVLTGCLTDTANKFNVATRTLSRILKSINENYMEHTWTSKIPKQDVMIVWEEFKTNGRLEPIAEKYGVHESNIRELFKKIDPEYTKYTKRKSRK